MSLAFSPLPFDEMNEADVREEVVAPLVRLLGYRTGSEFGVVREQSLRYPKQYLGRKNPSRDPELRGKADYILDIKSKVRWVLEAKAPGLELGQNDFEQAWSYANHPEVRAVYFALCNGRRLMVFSTSHGPDVAPILDILHSDFSAKWGSIVDVLGPTAIERDFPHEEKLASPPIGPGLRSIARVASGVIRYLGCDIKSPALSQLQTFILDGSLERDDKNCLTAFLRTRAPLQELQRMNELLGFQGLNLKSLDAFLSVDPQFPNIFTYQGNVTIPQGVEFLDINTWQRMRFPVTVDCQISTRATGVLDGHSFSGKFSAELHLKPILETSIALHGDFEIRIA